MSDDITVNCNAVDIEIGKPKSLRTNPASPRIVKLVFGKTTDEINPLNVSIELDVNTHCA